MRNPAEFLRAQNLHRQERAGGRSALLRRAEPGTLTKGQTGGCVPRWGAGFKIALKQNFNRTVNTFTHTTCLPLESNTITLDPEAKDAWGLPALRVTYKSHPDDFKTLTFLRDRSLELLDAAGAVR